MVCSVLVLAQHNFLQNTRTTSQNDNSVGQRSFGPNARFIVKLR